MKAAMVLLMVTGGALAIRYAFLGRNPWDDVLAIIRGTTGPTPNVSTDAGAGAPGAPFVPVGSTVGNQGGTVRSVTGNN